MPKADPVRAAVLAEREMVRFVLGAWATSMRSGREHRAERAFRMASDELEQRWREADRKASAKNRRRVSDPQERTTTPSTARASVGITPGVADHRGQAAHPVSSTRRIADRKARTKKGTKR